MEREKDTDRDILEGGGIVVLRRQSWVGPGPWQAGVCGGGGRVRLEDLQFAPHAKPRLASPYLICDFNALPASLTYS